MHIQTARKRINEFVRPTRVYQKDRARLLSAYRAYLLKNYGIQTNEQFGFEDHFGRKKTEIYCLGQRGFVVLKPCQMYHYTMELHVIASPGCMVDPKVHVQLSALIRERAQVHGYKRVVAVINVKNTHAMNAAKAFGFIEKSRDRSTDHEFVILEKGV